MFRGAGRGTKVLEERFGDSLKNLVAVTDRHSAYFAIDFLNNQICLAHLLRNLEYLNDIDKKQTWAKDVQTLLRGAIHLRNEKPDEVIPKDSWLTRLDELLKKNLDSLRKEFNELKRGIIRCRDYIFNFLENPAIPSDNNASERGIRKLKVSRKYPDASAPVPVPMPSTHYIPLLTRPGKTDNLLSMLYWRSSKLTGYIFASFVFAE